MDGGLPDPGAFLSPCPAAGPRAAACFRVARIPPGAPDSVSDQRVGDLYGQVDRFLMADQATKWQDLGQVSAMAMLRQLKMWPNCFL